MTRHLFYHINAISYLQYLPTEVTDSNLSILPRQTHIQISRDKRTTATYIIGIVHLKFHGMQWRYCN